MINKKKSDHCKNCGEDLPKLPNYCPQCGQENTTYRFTFGELVREFTESAFRLDARLYRSILPFLAMPGYLTNAFLEGRRKSYIRPIRLYLITSLFFFFVVKAFDLTKADLEGMGKEPPISEKEIRHHLKQTRYLLEVAEQSGELDSVERKQLVGKIDSLRLPLLSNHILNDQEQHVSLMSGKYAFSWPKLTHVWAKQEGMTPEILLDSMQVENPNFLDRMVANKFLKYGESNDPQAVLNEIIDNIPLLIFFLLPVFGLLLKLLYIRSGRLYVSHLIFAFYFHAYLFFMAGVAIVSAYWLTSWLAWALAAVTVVYAYFMFKKVYQQGWIKTGIKMVLLSWMYLIVLSFGFVIESVISLLTF